MQQALGSEPDCASSTGCVKSLAQVVLCSGHDMSARPASGCAVPAWVVHGWPCPRSRASLVRPASPRPADEMVPCGHAQPTGAPGQSLQACEGCFGASCPVLTPALTPSLTALPSRAPPDPQLPLVASPGTPHCHPASKAFPWICSSCLLPCLDCPLGSCPGRPLDPEAA